MLGSPTGRKAAKDIPEPHDWLVPTIIQFELMKWTTRVLGEERAATVLSFTDTCHIALLDSDLAVLAADVSREHKLSAADAIVYATAMNRGADLLTCDKHFAGLPSVVYIAKVG